TSPTAARYSLAASPPRSPGDSRSRILPRTAARAEIGGTRRVTSMRSVTTGMSGIGGAAGPGGRRPRRGVGGSAAASAAAGAARAAGRGLGPVEGRGGVIADADNAGGIGRRRGLRRWRSRDLDRQHRHCRGGGARRLRAQLVELVLEIAQLALLGAPSAAQLG